MHHNLGTPAPPPKTLGENLEAARASIVRYGPEWQADLHAAVVKVRGAGPAKSPHIGEGRVIEGPVNALLVKWGHPLNEHASARRIAQELKLFG